MQIIPMVHIPRMIAPDMMRINLRRLLLLSICQPLNTG
jgi:hypothetical protein